MVQNMKFRFTGGVNGRGLLDISKLKALGMKIK